MSGAILMFEGGRHAEAQRLLPWLANGTLEPDEAARVHRHLAGCRACQDELEALQSLRVACADADTPDAHDPDAGWARLRPRLGRRSTRTHVDARPPPWLGWALAAQAALLAAFAVALWQRPEPPAPYRLLGTSASAGDLIVVFDPRVDEATLRGLLRASGTRIVDGPNEAGAYVLAVPPARMASVRAALRAAPGVRLVESLAPESGAPEP